MTFRATWESRRPPSASKKAGKALFTLAVRYRDQLRTGLQEIDAAVFDLDKDEAEDLAAAVTEMAEDLHADAGLWRCLETYHEEFFGVPLPLLCRPGDAPLETFDPRRFQFFFYTVWRHFRPDHIVSPGHRGFVALARQASDFFGEAFASLPRHSPAADFLAGSNRRGWEVKRKLVWLGTRSFLFRFAYEDYMARQEAGAGEEIATTDDFLCQQCTEWSGLGVLDILAGALDLPEEDRAVLRGWHERHAAVYRIGRLDGKGSRSETLEAVNLINDRPYRIRMDMDRRTSPFQPGMAVYGSLVPWRGEWYWSGTQQILKLTPGELPGLRKRFRESHLCFRYCPDLERRAREIEAGQFADFTGHYGNDLVAFPDTDAATAAEEKRMRAFAEAKAGEKLPEILREHGVESPKLAGFPDSKDGVALFYNPGEGVDMCIRYGLLISGLEKRDEALTDDEAEAIQSFIEEDAVSPDFVRRVIRETGSAAIGKLYFLPAGPGGLDYLLRRFKGCYHRKRYPNLSLRE